MSAESDNQPLQLKRLSRGHIVLIVLTTVVGVLLGYLGSTQLSSASTSTTSILLNPLDGNPFYPSTRGEQLVNMGTEAEALRSEAVAAIAKEASGSDLDTATLLQNVSVKNPPNTQILEVSYRSEQAADASKLSQAFAEAYLEYRQKRAETVINEQVKQLDTQIDEAQSQMTSIAGQMQILPTSSPQTEVLRQQSQTVANQIASLNESRSDLTALPRDPGQVVTPASSGKSDISKYTVLLMVVGGILGAALGLAIAAARMASDHRVHRAQQLDELGMAVLGSFGTAVERSNRTDAMSLAEEQVSRIRAALIAKGRVTPWVLLVTGSAPRPHAPLVVPELAGSFARSGMQTLVLHATLQSTEPSPLVDADADVGLCQLLLGRTTLRDAIVHVSPMLSAIPVGATDEEISDLFVGDPMRRLVQDLKDRCDVLIVTADPITAGSTQSLTRVADAVLVEVDQHVTTTMEVQEAQRTLGILAAPVDGAVLIGPGAETWARNFTPPLTISQRELLPGAGQLTEGSGAVPLPAVSDDDDSTADEEPADDDAPTRPGRTSGDRSSTSTPKSPSGRGSTTRSSSDKASGSGSGSGSGAGATPRSGASSAPRTSGSAKRPAAPAEDAPAPADDVPAPAMKSKRPASASTTGSASGSAKRPTSASTTGSATGSTTGPRPKKAARPSTGNADKTQRDQPVWVQPAERTSSRTRGRETGA